MTQAALTIRAAMIEADRRARAATTGYERLCWDAVWWRLHARESRVPEEPMGYARTLIALARLERAEDYEEAGQEVMI